MLAVALVALIVLGPIVSIVLAVRALARLRRVETELQEQRARTDVLARRLREEPPGAAAEQALAGPDSPPMQATTAMEEEPRIPDVVAPAAPPPLPARPRAPIEPGPSPRPPRAAPTRPARKPIDIEALLGGSLLVWIGGIALALAGAFLVKYSLDQGWIGPPIRVALGVGFGLALIGVGEWLRKRSATVAQSACAAGVAVIFAALLAATNLYALVPPFVGFLALAATTAGAVVLSLRHGPFVAGLGLLGGFITPALIRAELPSAPLLFGYLLALQLGLLYVARSRGWWPLGLLTILGVHGWALVWLADLLPGSHEPWLGIFALASTACTVLLCLGRSAEEQWGRTGEQAVAPLMGWVGGVLGLLTTTAVVRAGAFSNMEWGFLLLLSIGGLVLAFFEERYEVLPWLTAGAGAVLLLDWNETGVPIAGRFALIATAFGAAHVVGAFLLSARAKRPDRWAALSAAATIAYLLTAWVALPDPPGLLPWGAIAALLAGLHAGAVLVLLPQRESTPGTEGRLAAHAVASSVLVSLAIAFELEREWMAVAWALQLPVLAWLNSKLRLRGLRVLGGVVGLFVVARLLLNPFVLEYPIGEMPIFDWLLWGYLVPAACCAVAARFYAELSDDGLVFGLEIGSVAFAGAWAALEIRHLFHPSDLTSSAWTLAEQGWIAVVFLAGGGALALWGAARERPGLRYGAHGLALLGLAGLLLGPGLVFNPLLRRLEVAGSPIFNTLLIAYGLPAALTAAWAVLLRLRGSKVRATVAAAAAVLLIFLFVSLEVRHWFHGAFLNSGRVDNGELYTYSAAWIVLAIVLLVAGLRLGSRALRQAALAVMLIVVAKVFLLDMRELDDLWRVLSFFGLGVSLLGLGYLYKRFVLPAD